MRTLTLSAVLLLAMPAFAEEPAAPADVMATPWSVGAGVGFGNGNAYLVQAPILMVGAGGAMNLGVMGALSAQAIPGVSFERRLTPRLSLGGTLSASVTSFKSSPVSAASTTSTTLSGALTVGPRWTLTGETAPVAVLVFVDAVGSILSSTYGLGDMGPVDLQTFSLGLAGGLGVERTLLPNLSLRIQSQLAHLTWLRTFQSAIGEQAPQYSTSFRAGVAPSAFAELRLAF